MSAATSGDSVIDEEGNLLGVVNIVDALVLLAVVAVVLAGVGLLLTDGRTDDPVETATVNVTVDLGTQPRYIASAIDEGDTYSPSEQSNLTITDIYLAPQGNQTRVLVRTELQGVATDDGFEYAGSPPRLGRELAISTATYNATGEVVAASGGPTLDTNTTTVVLQTTMSPSDASAVEPGDEVIVAGRTVATVDDVAVYARNSSNRQTVLVEAVLETYRDQDRRNFGDTTVRPGQQLGLPTDAYTIDGRIEHVDGGLGTEALTNRTVTLELERVKPAVATAIRPGLREQGGTVTTAVVTDVSTAPTPLVATTANGTAIVSDHPLLRDVTVTTELRVRETPSGIEFKRERMQIGSTVVLDLGPVTISPTVVDIDQ